MHISEFRAHNTVTLNIRQEMQVQNIKKEKKKSPPTRMNRSDPHRYQTDIHSSETPANEHK